MNEGFVEIPSERLPPKTLEALVEAFINREGTDYGVVERDLASKVADIMRQVRSGEVVICFDPRSETCNFLDRETVRRLRQEARQAD